jgi:Ca2+-binding RTX toxin-like protein
MATIGNSGSKISKSSSLVGRPVVAVAPADSSDTFVLDDSSITSGRLYNLSGPTGNLTDGYSGSFRTDGQTDVSYTGVRQFDITGTGFNDSITTGDGNDIVSGGDGSDTLTVGQGTNTVNGGAGIDYLSIDLSGQSVRSTINLTKTTAQASGGTNSITGMESFTGTVTGSNHGDILTEADDSGSATFNMGTGNDYVGLTQSSGAANIVNMGDGTDTLSIDNSTLTGTRTYNETALTGSLATGYSGSFRTDGVGDISFSGVENFNIKGASGNNLIQVGDGNDVIVGNIGNDTLTVGQGTNTVDGGAGTDYLSVDLSGQTVASTIDLTKSGAQASGGTNSITNMESFTGTVTGSSHGDRLVEGDNSGTATFNMGSGNDYVGITSNSNTTNTVNMGDGTDTLSIDDSALTGTRTYNLEFNGSLAAGYSGRFRTDGYGDVGYSGVENFNIKGANGQNEITVGDGNDIVTGNASDDTLAVGLGNNTVDGGAGGNNALSIDLSAQTVGVTIDLTKTGQQDTGGTNSIKNINTFTGTVTGSSHNDTFIEADNSGGFRNAGATINAGDGNDVIKLASPANVDTHVDGGTGTDTLSIDDSALTGTRIYNIEFSGSVAAGYTGRFRTDSHGDVYYANIENFDVYGADGQNEITVGDGNDIVTGNASDDVLVVGQGANTVDGGASGNDALSIDLSAQTVGVSIDLTKTGQEDVGGTNSIQNIETFTGTVTGTSHDDSFIEADNSGGFRNAGATINAGAGNDLVKLVSSSNVDTHVDGGTGTDTLSIDDSALTDGSRLYVQDALTAEPTDTGYSGRYRTDSHGDVYYADIENFDLYGTGANDVVQTGDGNDIVNGNAGDDTITVGKGTNAVDGGDGNDALSIDLSAQTKGSTIDLTKTGQQASGGTNSIQNFETFTGTVTGSDFNDTFVDANNSGGVTGQGATFNTGAGDDLVKVVSSNNIDTHVDGGTGNDMLVIDSSGLTDGSRIYVQDALTPESGDTGYSGRYRTESHGDVYYADIENFKISGNSGNDIVQTGDGDDFVFGNGGDDTVGLGKGANTADGGDGNDYLSIDLSGQAVGSTIDLTKTGQQDVGGTNSIKNFETFTGTVTGSNFNDTLIEANNSGGATFNTGAGDDLVKVVSSNNVDSHVDGGTGNDTLVIDDRGITDNSRMFVQDALTPETGDTGYSGRFRTDSHGDVYYADIENFNLYGAGGNDILTTGSGTDIVYGDGGDDTISTGDGNDLVEGGTGTNSLDGGTGNDTVTYFDAASGVTVDLTQQGAAQNTGVSTDTLNGFENVTGSAFADTLTGDANANVLNGGVGADTMSGGAGDDTYYVDNTGDTVNEGTGAGTDTVISSVTYTLGANVEKLVLSGSGNINGTGNSLANTITGNSGNNVLSGGAGADIMTGGAGNDTYIVDNTGDVVNETVNGGNDTIHSSVSYSLSGRYVETLTLTGASDINATGNGQANTLNGNSGNNILDGAAGADVMAGGAGDDTYYVDNVGDTVNEGTGAGTDTVISSITYTLGANVEKLVLSGTASINGTGNALANSITGNSGNNVLNGGAGADIMTGGAGNDTYIVDSTGDVVNESSTGGNDTILSSVSYSLHGLYVETLTLTGASNINATGNGQANTLNGNSGNNILDGAAGADVMAGGNGDDTYYVDNVGDNVVESSATGGNDTINASVSYDLKGRYVETLNLTGTASINATGNGQANTLNGNSGNNVLDGQAGADTMTGGTGDDTYYVDNVGDNVVEHSGGGNDTINSSVSYSLKARYVETLNLTGTASINATGNNQANTLVGNNGSNVIDGGGGSDTLTGGGGADTFLFDTSLSLAGLATITDFSVGQDMIDLDSAIFKAISGSGTLSSAAFGTGTSATTAAQRIIYDAGTGDLFYDADGSGSGAQVQFATLGKNLALIASSFTVGA